MTNRRVGAKFEGHNEEVMRIWGRYLRVTIFRGIGAASCASTLRVAVRLPLPDLTASLRELLIT